MSSNLIDHANRELDLLGWPQLTREQMRGKFPIQSDDDYDRMLRKAILQLVTDFAGQNHSGHSAAMVISITHKLLQFQNLSPITDNPDEWIQQRELVGFEVWQNRRNSTLFSSDGGKTYYGLDDPMPAWAKWVKKNIPIAIRSRVWKKRNPIHFLELKRSAHVDAE